MRGASCNSPTARLLIANIPAPGRSETDRTEKESSAELRIKGGGRDLAVPASSIGPAYRPVRMPQLARLPWEVDTDAGGLLREQNIYSLAARTREEKPFCSSSGLTRQLG